MISSQVKSVIANAKHAQRLANTYGSFSAYLWSFVGGAPIINSYRTLKEVPTQDENAERMSKALKKEGFKFVGPVICYSFMQVPVKICLFLKLRICLPLANLLVITSGY